MSDEKNTLNQTLEHSALGELIEGLLNEHYGVKNDFANLNLESIGQLIEDARQHYEHPDSLTPEFLSEMESFERCKSLYCLLLLEFELLNFQELPTDPISSLRTAPVPPKDFVPDEEDAMSEKTMLYMGVSGPLAETLAPMPKPRETSPLQSQDTSRFLSLASFLHGLTNREDYSLPTSYLFRFEGQSLCFAAETEAFARLGVFLKGFWNVKKAVIPTVLDGRTQGFEWHPQLKEGIESLAQEYSGFLFDDRFPVTGALNSLKYLYSVQDFSKFKPAPLDFAVILAFFGYDGTAGEFPLHNHLQISGLEPSEIIELSFRFTRLQKLKAKTLSISNEFMETDLKQLEEDVKAILGFLNKISGNDVSNLQVA